VIRGAVAAALACACAATSLSACESTQDTSARLAKRAKGLANQQGLRIARDNPSVRVATTAVVHDANGIAAVVELQNTGPAQAALPVAIAVDDAKGKPIFRNDAAGLDPSLVQMPLLRKGESAWWVNNQVTAAGVPAKVAARVGEAKAPAPADTPVIEISKVHVGSDADGVFAEGFVANRSKIAQKRLTIFCVARRAGRVVAAGRAIIDRLPPAPTPKPTKFTVFFIGNPKGARLEFAAPPTVLK
jgi:hypothetical protein